MISESIVTVFRTRVRPGFDDELSILGERMYSLASSMPGFVSYKDYAAADGESLSIIEFTSMDHLAAWRNHPEHVEARKAGREKYFEWFQIQVCRTERAYSFPDSAADGNAGA